MGTEKAPAVPFVLKTSVRPQRGTWPHSLFRVQIPRKERAEYLEWPPHRVLGEMLRPAGRSEVVQESPLSYPVDGRLFFFFFFFMQHYLHLPGHGSNQNVH